MTIGGATITGYVAQASEGRAEPGWPSCTRIVDRTEFTFTVQANVMSGTVAVKKAYSGAQCPSGAARSIAVSGTRTVPGVDALQGSWQVTGIEERPLALTVSVGAGSALISSARADISLAARKR
jgi:hypothetical protein